MPVKCLLAAYLILLGNQPLQAAPSEVPTGPRWYQVELVIFALNDPLENNEAWPVVQLAYPHNMVAPAPLDVASRSPGTRQQVEELMDLEALLDLGPVPEESYEPSGELDRVASSNELTPETAVSQRDTETGADSDINSTIEEPLDLATLLRRAGPAPYGVVETGELLLRDQARSIRRSRSYRLLLHTAWRQPMVYEAEGTPVLLQAGRHFDDWHELDGTISIRLSRFLHVETDLWFTEFTQAFPTAGNFPAAAPGADDVLADYPKIAAWEANRGNFLPVHSHRLNESRRMRSRTLHYLDHPLFGVLVRIDRYRWKKEIQDVNEDRLSAVTASGRL